MVKFKEGDRVKCVGDYDLKAIKDISRSEIDRMKIGHGWRKDLIFIIKEAYGDGGSDTICWGGYGGRGVFGKRLVKLDKQLKIE